MKLKIALLPGDGIGPEIVGEAVKVLDSVAAKYGHQFEYSKALVGACAIDATGDPYPAETHAVCEASDVVLFGAIGDPKYDRTFCEPSSAGGVRFAGRAFSAQDRNCQGGRFHLRA